MRELAHIRRGDSWDSHRGCLVYKTRSAAVGLSRSVGELKSRS